MEFWNGNDLQTDLTLCQGLFELSSDGFILVDKQGKVVYINQTYCTQLGVDQKAALGQPVQKIITNTSLNKMVKNRFYTPDHNILWQVNPGQYTSQEKHAVVSRCNVKDESGNVIGAVGQVKFINETLRLSRSIQELNDELDYLKSEMVRLGKSRYSLESIVGNSEAIMTAKSLAKKAAGNDFPVLLTGESGTGKEVFANSIHYSSQRRSRPIVRVNCAAIPGDLFESELFGYSEGAFTGAKKGGKKGKVLLANQGTLFLDEIGEMPLPMQAKLLRVLQEQELEVVGGEAPIPIDVRFIAATNKNILAEIRAGRFRLDLYYRLNVIELYIPSLRERAEDIMPLAEGFLSEINRNYSTTASFATDVQAYLKDYHWPGNVRELRNVIERAYMLSEGKQINTSHFALQFSDKSKATRHLDKKLFEELKDEFEHELITEALQSCSGNVKKCADILQMHRSTLYNKLNRYQQKEPFQTRE